VTSKVQEFVNQL